MKMLKRKISVSVREQKQSKWPQVMCAVAAGMAAASQGCCFTYPSRALTQLQNEENPELRISLHNASWFASLYLICSIPCGPLGGLLSNHFGCRKCFLFFSLPMSIGWTLIALSTNVHLLFLGKFCSATGATCLASSISVYISETAHPSLRGSLLVFQSLFLSIGMLIVFGVGYFFEWRILAWICGIPAGLLFTSMLFLPETPYWLVQNGYETEAMKSLQFLRGQHYDVTEEYDEMLRRRKEKESLATSSTNGRMWMLKRLFSPGFICTRRNNNTFDQQSYEAFKYFS